MKLLKMMDRLASQTERDRGATTDYATMAGMAAASPSDTDVSGAAHLTSGHITPDPFSGGGHITENGMTVATFHPDPFSGGVDYTLF